MDEPDDRSPATQSGAFLPGLLLCRRFFEEAGRPIIERVMGAVPWSAGLMGKGSDVLGFDSAVSMDHDWGPRFQVFLPDDAPRAAAERLDAELRRGLPRSFLGFPVSVPDPDPLETGAAAEDEEGEGPVAHLVEIATLGAWLPRFLGRDPRGGLDLVDWLTFPEQRLIELTTGDVFHDPRGELAAVRALLSYHPRDAWLYRMACQWQRLSQEEAFVGRCAAAGDELGMRVLAARVVRDVMKLCFLVERRYAPYDKWLGTAFARLSCAPAMQPDLTAALTSSDYAALEERLVSVYRRLAGMHNALGVTGRLDEEPRTYLSRPYRVIRADRFANALLRVIADETLKRLPVRMGAIDQFVDCTDFIESVGMYRKTLALYL